MESRSFAEKVMKGGGIGSPRGEHRGGRCRRRKKLGGGLRVVSGGREILGRWDGVQQGAGTGPYKCEAGTTVRGKSKLAVAGAMVGATGMESGRQVRSGASLSQLDVPRSMCGSNRLAGGFFPLPV